MYRKTKGDILENVLSYGVFCTKRSNFDDELAYVCAIMFFIFFVIATPLWLPVYVLGKIMRKKEIE